MEAKKNLLTAEGLKVLEDELEDLKVNKRKEVSQKIKEAREQGDLSENAEYDAAKDEQKEIEARIEELESILKNVEIVYTDEVDKEKVNVGCAVTVKRLDGGKVEKFKLVGSTEADFLNNKISNESPIGAALMGSKTGDVVEVEAPNGSFKIEIIDISLDEE